MTYILGVSGFYHDSAAALLKDGVLVAAAQEERFTRKKHDAGFPVHAIKSLLEGEGITLGDVEHVAFYDKPFLKFERLLETYVATVPRGFASFRAAMPIWLKEKLFLKRLLRTQLTELDPDFSDSQLLFSEHHISHAASAYYPSPYDEAVVLTVDGVGEWATTTLGIGRGHSLEIKKEIHFPHSLGLLYSAFTHYTGFRVNSGEYKVMGLAPYGTPRFKDLILDKIMDLKADGSFRLNQDYFDYATGLKMTNKAFAELFGAPVRKPDTDPLTQFHMDIAASVQAVTEEAMLRLSRAAADEYGISNLCLAGGVALNCVANGKMLRDKAFKNIWVQPAAGDAGGAVGAAFAAWHQELDNPRHSHTGDRMKGAYLGPSFKTDRIMRDLDRLGAVYEHMSQETMLEETARALADGLAVGWFQGRMEFGPRALGGRSILGDPRSASMQRTLNLKVKYRESFRPFAPSVLNEDASDWFDLDTDSPYMLIVADVHKKHWLEMTEAEQALFGIDKLNIARSSIPAITHVDYSARIQTVHADTNPLYHRLISEFKKITGCPVIVNTSFNVRGEPIVGSPEDAFRCFMGTELDLLAIGNLILRKPDQDQRLHEDYTQKYELD